MREILFRGIRMDNGVWVAGQLVVTKEGAFIAPKGYRGSVNISSITGFVEVVPESVGQYIGLTDKNGKKIFEGDIFKFDDEIWSSSYTSCGTEYDSCEVENYGVVGFDDERACYDFVKYKFNENSVDADLHENHNIDFFWFLSDLEVVDNVHDNPELLINTGDAI